MAQDDFPFMHAQMFLILPSHACTEVPHPYLPCARRSSSSFPRMRWSSSSLPCVCRSSSSFPDTDAQKFLILPSHAFAEVPHPSICSHSCSLSYTCSDEHTLYRKLNSQVSLNLHKHWLSSVWLVYLILSLDKCHNTKHPFIYFSHTPAHVNTFTARFYLLHELSRPWAL